MFPSQHCYFTPLCLPQCLLPGTSSCQALVDLAISCMILKPQLLCLIPLPSRWFRVCLYSLVTQGFLLYGTVPSSLFPPLTREVQKAGSSFSFLLQLSVPWCGACDVVGAWMDAEAVLFSSKNIRVLGLGMDMSLLCNGFSYPWSGGMKLWMKEALSQRRMNTWELRWERWAGPSSLGSSLCVGGK